MSLWWDTIPDWIYSARVWLEDVRDDLGARMRGDRPYRFDGEQANHADQAAQTMTSLGLMAAAAKQGDDDHRLQAMQTENTMRERKAVLETHRRERGLTAEERWELESIKKGLDDLIADQGATPSTVGNLRMGLLGTVGAASPVAALAANPLTWAAVGLALSIGSCSVQTARLNNAKADLSETRADLEMAERNLENASAVNARLAQAVREADVLSQQTAANLEAERARNRALRTRQMERDREAREVLSRNVPPAWDDRLRDLQARTGGDRAAGDRAE